MMYYFILLLVICAFLFDNTQAYYSIRKTQYGLIRGEVKRSEANASIEYFSYRGIRYGQAPIGKLRFQEPQPPEPWLGIEDAIEPAVKCVQIDDNFNGHGVVGTEDCLKLNVFVPKTARKHHLGLLPVLIWIHGGTFIYETMNTSGPDYLMEKPIILVEIEYRLNVFGFLSCMDKYAKGNLGLKDQLLGLKWVKDNIRYFGGDPNQVTLSGESAGAASVMYHMVSRRSQGLFHKAIGQSATTFNRWALQNHPKEMTLRLAKGVEIEETDCKTVIEKLQKIDYKIIMQAAFNKSIVGFYTPYYAQPFAPIIEYESDTAILSESSFKLLQQGNFSRVPYILGFNTEEGAFAYNYIQNGRVDIKIYEEHPELLIPISMNVSAGSQCYQKTIDIIKAFYFKNGNVTDKNNWIPYMSQELFVRGIIKAMEIMYQQTPLYFYRFSYAGSRPMSYLGGVGHAEELQYLYYPRKPASNPVESDSDKLMRKRMVTLWSNFVITGNPTPEKDQLLQNVIWPKVNTEKLYLDIDVNLTVLKNPNHEDSEFWEDLFDLCGKPPYVTY